MDNPLVSVITPTYNHERHIRACIESVLGQSYTIWEQIIIDDASWDGTAEIIGQYASKDQRIKLISHTENCGITSLGDTYNEALSVSKGRFVAVLEGDDCWPSDKLEKQLELFCDQKIVVTWGAGHIIDGDGKVLGRFSEAWRKWPEDVMRNRPVGNTLKLLLLRNFLTPSAALMFRRQPLLEIGGFWQPESCFCVDYPTCLKMSLKGEFMYSREVMGFWRYHSNQVTAQLMNTPTTIAGEAFWNSLSELEKRQLGLEKMERPLLARSSWIRGRRLMALGQAKRARYFFVKALFANQGIVSVKSGIVLVMSLFCPSLVQDMFATALTDSIWLKKFLWNNAMAVGNRRPMGSHEMNAFSAQGAAEKN